MNHTKTPLFDGILNYTKDNITYFDVPGHKNTTYLDELETHWGEMPLKMDLNSSKAVDNLSNPIGIIKEAEALLADAYNADHAYMLVNGSTSGIQYMIMSTINQGDKILMPRNVHKSAINGLILAGAIPVFIDVELDLEYGIANGMSTDSIKHALDLHEDIKAVFVIHPTYFGVTSNLKEIIDLCHARSVPVLVDQAHGAHFGFHPNLPPSATSLGADLVTISMHKTGGALTQTSVLFHNQGLISKNKVRSTINLLQTTSASYLLMSSIDVARKKLMTEGYERLEELLRLTRALKQEINKIPGLCCIEQENYNKSEGSFDFDELKVVIKTESLGLSGFEVYDILAERYHIQLELAEPLAVLAIISFGDTKQSIDKLLNALKHLSSQSFNVQNKATIPHPTLKNPKVILSPREAYYHPQKTVHIENSEGFISGESIMIYPPGIPIVIPGELITKDIIKHYMYLKSQGSLVLNDNDDPYQIQVLDRHKEDNMIDLWYTENHQEDTKFSIQVTEHLHSEKSDFQQIDFFKSKTFGTFFTLDGLMMVTEKDEFIYHDMITHIPMAVNPNIKKVLVIGGGDGGTAREVLRYPGVTHVDMVEIDERVVRLCQKYLPQTAHALDTDERLNLHFEDGLKFVQDAPEGFYDLILVDSTDPIGPGEGLFTYEFYNNCKRVLSEDGILINQHESPYYDTYSHEMKRAHSKIKDTFPITQVYQFHMPTYPSGHWLFGFASKKYDPIKDLKAKEWEALNIKTKYYNTNLHVGCFMLPTYVKDALENA